MVAMTQDRNTARRERGLLQVLVAASAVIFAGSIVCVNAGGFAVEGDTDPDLIYMGRAEHAVDNTGGADGDVSVLVRNDSTFQFANSAIDPVTQANLGMLCWVEDNQTVAATDGTGTRSACGRVVGIDSEGVWVE
jgi:hypothetical protein